MNRSSTIQEDFKSGPKLDMYNSAWSMKTENVPICRSELVKRIEVLRTRYQHIH